MTQPTPAQPPPPSSVPRAAGRIGQPRSPGLQILLAIVTLGIYTFFWVYWQHKEIKEYSGEGVGGAIGVVIYIFVSPVTWFLLPSEIRKMYEAEGRDPGFTVLIGLWFLLPIVGAFIWYFKVQPALNEFWVSKGASPA
jgi:Domain of unknown function (DUF4234)